MTLESRANEALDVAQQAQPQAPAAERRSQSQEPVGYLRILVRSSGHMAVASWADIERLAGLPDARGLVIRRPSGRFPTSSPMSPAGRSGVRGGFAARRRRRNAFRPWPSSGPIADRAAFGGREHAGPGVVQANGLHGGAPGGERVQADFSRAGSMGRRRMRTPVAAKIALQTAGAIGGVPGSPTPPGAAPLSTMWTSTRGISFMRNTR